MSGPRRRLSLLHLSDVHATVDASLYGAIDGIARMRAASEHARAAGFAADAIIVSGDLIERGSADAYPAVRDALLQLEADWGVPVLSVLGNHDDRVAARLLPCHEPIAVPRAVRVGDWRFLLLDSVDGALGSAQLDWLHAELAQPHGSGSVVVSHHPPLGSPLPMLSRAGLADAEQFLDVVEGTDVRAVLSGHFHHPLTATTRGVHVSVAPALAYHQVMDAAPGTLSGHDRSMYSLVHLTEGTVSASSVTVETPTRLFTIRPPHPTNPAPLTHPASLTNPASTHR